VDYPGVEPMWLFSQVDITTRKRAEAERAALLVSERDALASAEGSVRRLQAIQVIARTALANVSLDESLGQMLAHLRRALRCEFATLLEVDGSGTQLDVRAVDGFDHDAAVKATIDAPIAARTLVEQREALIGATLHDASPEWNVVYHGRGVRSTLSAPFFICGRVSGIVSVASTSMRAFDADDVRLLEIVADHFAPVIERARLLETVRAGKERLEALSRQLMNAQEAQRRRLAVELHDDLGQILTAIKIRLGVGTRTSGVADAAWLRDGIDGVDQALQRVRDLALDLRPSVLDDLGLAAALRWHVDRVARMSGIEMFQSIDDLPAVDPDVGTACFRLAQEALTNIVRHARATRVWVDIHCFGSTLALRVRDDGCGFDVARARAGASRGLSLGLAGMEERVALMGGELDLSSEPGRGSEVRCRLPLAPGRET